jgi:hypothetical protein
VDYTSTREGGQYRHRLSPRSYLSDRIVCTMLAEDVRDLLGAPRVHSTQVRARFIREAPHVSRTPTIDCLLTEGACSITIRGPE